MSAPTWTSKLPPWAAKFANRRAAVAGALILILIVGTLGLTRFLTAPEYRVLYSGLTATDAAAVTAALDSSATPYELQAGGTTILVPDEVVDKTRIALASESLPKSSTVGYELLDTQSITTDSFTQQVNYQRALEGELSRTLTAIEGVDAASVRIVMPKERLFTDAETPARAAVLLTASGSVTDENVTAITRLVSSSVPGLDATNVTVTDSTGRLLTTGDGEAGTGSNRKDQSAYETKLEEAATTMLTAVVGPGKSVVRVNAAMDFTKRTRATEEYDPKKSATKSKTSSKERYSTTEPLPEGELDSDPANRRRTTETKEKKSNYSKNDAAEALNNTKTISQEIEAPGAVTKLTVSVLVDDAAAGNLPANQVEDLVSNALGVDLARGDSVVVETAPFDTSADAASKAAEKDLAEERADKARSKMITAGIIGGVLALAVIFLGIIGLRSRRTKVDDEEATAAAAAAAASLNISEDTTPTTRMPLAVNSNASESANVLQSVKERPADTAQVLRGMMAADQIEENRK